MLPENATKKTITWRSANTKIATVRSGTVAAVAEGTVEITATSGDVVAVCVITVKLPDGIDNVTGDKHLNIYDITGRPVRTDAKSIDGLEKGVYIINGQKTIIK